MTHAVEYVLSGELREASFEQVHRALLELGAPIRIRHDVELDWIQPGVDIGIYVDDVAGGGYLLRGTIGSDRQDALERTRSLSRCLERHDVVYRLELDADAADGEHVLTACHPRFPAP